MKTGIYVYCTTSFIGFHRWPSAPVEVSHLRERHRHIFHVKVILKVTHSDRDIEFQLLKNKVDDIIVAGDLGNLGKITDTRSCEQFGTYIANELKFLKYNVQSVEVNEDNENGAIVVC